MALETPIIYLVFNRPDLTAMTFEAIRKQQPKTLLIVADGPRNAEEAAKCAAVRDIVANVDWECHVLRNYSDINLGCRRRVSSGITWAFEQVEEAIILEDDCLPSDSFFRFCEELLEKYRHDSKVMNISGTSFLTDDIHMPYSYYFTPIMHMWGWGTWKRAWAHYDDTMGDWTQRRHNKWLKSIFRNPDYQFYWDWIFQRTHDGEVDTWDYPWIYSCLVQSGLTINPTKNLVSNLGFRADATHTRDMSFFAINQTVGPLKFPLVHPPAYWKSADAEKATFNAIYRFRKPRHSLLFRIKSFLKDNIVAPLHLTKYFPKKHVH